jgi:F-type H+-transporting ATPase subunit a
MAGPLDQFKLNSIIEFKPFGIDLSITNGILMLFLVTSALILFLLILTSSLSVKPSKKQVVAEGFYNFIAKMISSNVNYKNNMAFFPLIFSLFMFILFANAFGVIPYTFTITSHISLTLAIALIVFAMMIVIGIKRKGFFGYFAFFVPNGVPVFIAPLIFIIEFFTYLIRPFTLALRLAANMIAGHTMLKVIAGFVVAMGFFGFVPVVFMSLLTGFELFVAGLQAYIFSMLTCIYINEALNTEH